MIKKGQRVLIPIDVYPDSDGEVDLDDDIKPVLVYVEGKVVIVESTLPEEPVEVRVLDKNSYDGTEYAMSKDLVPIPPKATKTQVKALKRILNSLIT